MKSLSKYQKLYHCQYIYMYQSKFHLTNLKTWSLKQNCSKHLSKKKKNFGCQICGVDKITRASIH